MSIYNLACDKILETEGSWVDINHGIEVRVTRFGNRKYREKMRKLVKPYRQMLKDEEAELPPEVAERLEVKAIAHALLMDWRGPGMVDKLGAVIPFSVEKAEELLTEVDWLREQVLEASRLRETFRRQEIAEDGEALGKASGSSSNGGRGSKSSSP